MFLIAGNVSAFPEFQEYVQKASGRAVNCALCHAHPDGPDGAGPGQIGSLSSAEFDRLNLARSAFEPGRAVDSPILNDFGDAIIERVGKKKFLELKRDPGALGEALGMKGDLDDDGIPDAREYLDGTHPLKAMDGNPWRLLWVNLERNWLELFVLLLATVLGLWGLNNLLHGFAGIFREEEE